MSDPAYILVSVNSTDISAIPDLENEVNKKIKVGYKPLGQPFVNQIGGFHSLCQAMILPAMLPD